MTVSSKISPYKTSSVFIIVRRAVLLISYWADDILFAHDPQILVYPTDDEYCYDHNAWPGNYGGQPSDYRFGIEGPTSGGHSQ